MPEEHRDLIPRAPTTRTMADFIVVVFVIMVVTIMVSITLGALILAIFTDDDVKPFLSVIVDMMSTIIAALVGFLAGRGTANGKNGNGKVP